LGIEDLEVFRMFFRKVNVKFFHLSALLLVPFRKTSFFPKLLPVLNKLDQWLLSSEVLGKYAWIMTIEISEPIK